MNIKFHIAFVSIDTSVCLVLEPSTVDHGLLKFYSGEVLCEENEQNRVLTKVDGKTGIEDVKKYINNSRRM